MNINFDDNLKWSVIIKYNINNNFPTFRCVVIDRSNSLPIPGLLDNLSFLTYDCEVRNIIQIGYSYIPLEIEIFR